MTDTYLNSEPQLLDQRNQFVAGSLPDRRHRCAARFEAVWNYHQENNLVCMIHGSLVKKPKRKLTLAPIDFAF